MLKNKFKIIAILSVIILALTLPIVRAENDMTDDSANVTKSENISNETTNPAMDLANNPEAITTNTDDQNFKRSDVYLTGDNVTIDYIIDGNLFVVANNVTINSQIGGDAFICANSVTIEEQGYVFSNLFTFSKNVTIKGVVYDLYAASENTTINGFVYRDVRIGSNTVNLFGSVGRNAYIGTENLNFTQNNNTNEGESAKGIISGNLTYSATKQATIPEGAVTGETIFNQENSFDGNTFQKQILSLGTFLATVIIIWLLCLWLSPKFLKKAPTFLTTKKVLPIIGFGILTPIVSILLSVLLFVLGITSTLGLLLLITLSVLIAISTSIFIITINYMVCNKFKIEKTTSILGMLILSSIVLWLIGLIPYIGSLVALIAIILGLGIIIANLVLKEKTQDTNK